MKNIQAQYQDLLEGTMSSANFMVNVRRQFPQWVSSTNSVNDAVNILKAKRILSEMAMSPSAEDLLKQKLARDPKKLTYALKALDVIQDMNPEMSADELADEAMEQANLEMGLPSGDTEHEYGDDDMFETLNEAAKKSEGKYKEVTGKAEYDAFPGADHVNYHQLMKGLQYELSKMEEITDEALVKAKQKAVKNLVKDPNAYRDLVISNTKDVKKKDEALKMQPVKKDNTVDKANAMKVVEKDAKGNVQDSLGKKERAKSKNGEGIKQMTQTPKKAKGIAQTMEVPGKEKVLALKEHLLEDLTVENPIKKHFSVGQRVETKDGRFAGIITKFDGHVATVKLDHDGSERDIQPNVLQHSTAAPRPAVPQVPADHLKNMPGLGSVKEVSKEDKLKAIKEKLMNLVKKEGAVAQTASGVTVASGLNSGDVIKRAQDLKKQTGDSFTVLDTKSGVRSKI
jgi:hypothetical protein